MIILKKAYSVWVDRFLSKPIEATLHPESPATDSQDDATISLDNLREAEKAFDIGKGLMESSKWKQAWKAFAQVIEINPNRAEAYYERAKIAGKMNRIDLAIQEMSAGIELDSRNYQALRDRGNFYSQQEDYVKAIADYSAALKLYPPYVSAYTGRGEARLKRGDIRRAITDFELGTQNSTR